MSATREQIYAALQAADKAGNVDDAKALAKQYASTPATAAPTAKPATFLSTVGRAAYNLPMDTAETLKGAMDQFGPDGVVAQTVMHPVRAFDAARDWTHNAADILGGAAQHVREMSPAAEQGSAPKMDTAAFDSALAAAKQKYGTKQGIYKEVGDHPLGPVIAAASLAVPALRATGVGDSIEAAAAPVAARVGAASDILAEPLKNVATAERRGTAAADAMRADASGRLTDAQAAAEADASAVSDRASRVAALSDRARAQGKALNDRSSAAAAEATPPAPAIGEPAHLSDIGDTLRTPALAQQDTLNADMRAADDKYRSAMQKVADDRAAAGVGVSDSPLAKAMIKQSQAIVEPNPVTRPSVGAVPADSAGAKLHKQLLQVLQPTNVALSDKEAVAAAKTGVDVKTGADGGKFRVVKPSMQNLDDFRRLLGKVLNGQVEGYEGLNANEARNMYGNVSKVIDKYALGASKPVQANWRAGKQALSPFENVRAGRAVVGTQPGTDVASVPASAIPGRMIAGGRDTLKQVSAVSGDAPVSAALRSQVQNKLAGAANADAAEDMVRPGTTLGDAVNTDDSLTAAVRDHIASMRTAEQRGVDAQNLSRRSATAMSRSATWDKVAQTLEGTAAKTTVKARGYQQELSSLSAAEPRQVGSKYLDVLKRAHADGTITTDQLNSGLQLAAVAEKAFALKATRDTWMRQAAITLGVSGLGAAGVSVLHSAIP